MKKRMRVKPFTLLEVMLVFTLIALIFGIGAIQIPKAFRSEIFFRSVDKLAGKIELAQEVALDYGAELFLVLKEGDTALECYFVAEKNLPSELIKKLNRDPILPGIINYSWESTSGNSLFFSFSERSFPKGILSLKGTKECSLYLPGYPAKIVKYKNTHEINEIKASYPQEVLSIT